MKGCGAAKWKVMGRLNERLWGSPREQTLVPGCTMSPAGPSTRVVEQYHLPEFQMDRDESRLHVFLSLLTMSFNLSMSPSADSRAAFRCSSSSSSTWAFVKNLVPPSNVKSLSERVKALTI